MNLKYNLEPSTTIYCKIAR